MVIHDMHLHCGAHTIRNRNAMSLLGPSQLATDTSLDANILSHLCLYALDRYERQRSVMAAINNIFKRMDLNAASMICVTYAGGMRVARWIWSRRVTYVLHR